MPQPPVQLHCHWHEVVVATVPQFRFKLNNFYSCFALKSSFIASSAPAAKKFLSIYNVIGCPIFHARNAVTLSLSSFYTLQ